MGVPHMDITLNTSAFVHHLSGGKKEVETCMQPHFISLYVLLLFLLSCPSFSRWWQEVPPKCLYLSARLHGVTSQKTVIFVFTAVRTTDLTFVLVIDHILLRYLTGM
jgi:hypothetical protein